MYRKVKILFFFTIFFLIVSCASAPGKPVWINEIPQEKLYYVGIGFSNTGVQGKDRELARKAAIGELSASISTRIRGELEVIQQDSSDGENFQRINRKITENINHSLEGIDVYDSYYSEQDGYWVYVRLSKAEFEMQKQNLRQRVLSVVEGIDSSDILASISSLTTGLKLLGESPYIASIMSSDSSGTLFDELEEDLYSDISKIVITVPDDVINAEPGRAVFIKFSVARDKKPVAGFPVKIIIGEKTASVSTESDGTFSGGIEMGSLPVGETNMSITADFDKLDISSLELTKKITPPGQTCILKINQLKANLAFVQTGGEAIPGIDGMVKALFSESRFPLTITKEAANIVMDVELIVEDFPRYGEDSMYISQARLIIKMIKDGDVVYTYETDPAKNGGLTQGQSYERTVKKLFSALGNDTSYLQAITEHLGIE